MNLPGEKFLEYLQCLSCRSGFSSFNEKEITCENGHEFKIDEEVLVLEEKLKLDDKYVWGPKLRDPNENQRLDSTAGPASKESARKRMLDSLNFIESEFKISNKSPILDIATGRGMLMRKLVQQVQDSTIFISDLDVDVLVGTNKLLKPLNKNNILVPIKTSATHLPFKDGSVSTVVCYGVNNIRDTVSAFSEVHRVLTLGGKFILTFALIEKDSASYNWLMTQEDKPGPFDIIDGWKDEITKIGFKLAQSQVLFDGPIEKIALDLLPIKDGERGQDVGLVLER